MLTHKPRRPAGLAVVAPLPATPLNVADLPAALGRLVDAPAFQRFILALIVAASILVGLETDPEIAAAYGPWLALADVIIIAIFALEAILKMARHGHRFHRYFRDPWNVFDFTIVVVCLLPADTQYAAILRVARVFRALRLISAVPKLQLLTSSLIKSIPAMFYVGLLLAILFYVYAVMGVFFWRDNDPVHFADIPTAALTLFRVVTLEDWTDVMYAQMFGTDAYPVPGIAAYATTPTARPVLAAGYFVSFVLLGTMIMLNLFIGVILSSMQEAQDEHEKARAARAPDAGLTSELARLEQELDQLRGRLRVLRHSAENGGSDAVRG
jgi:voltage-gated sodium channel